MAFDCCINIKPFKVNYMKRLDNLVQLLSEEINDSSAIVYHRSRSGENLWNNLASGKLVENYFGR